MRLGRLCELGEELDVLRESAPNLTSRVPQLLQMWKLGTLFGYTDLDKQGKTCRPISSIQIQADAFSI